MPLLQLIEKACSKYADRCAIVDQGGVRRTTYAELMSQAQHVAAYIQRQNLVPQSFVCLHMPLCMEFLATEVGIWMSGHIVVPVGDNYPASRIQKIQTHCDARLTMGMEQYRQAQQQLGTPLMQRGENALLIYTSGSTGTPKGILHDFDSLLNAFHLYEEFSPTDKDRFAYGAPIYFIAQLQYFLFVYGTEVHMLDAAITHDVEALARYYTDHRITMTTISPSVLAMFHNTDSCLRCVWTGSENVVGLGPQDFRLYNLYGCTETGGPMCYAEIKAPSDHPSAGKPVGGVEYRIIDGEICFKGHFCQGYFRDEERTAELYRDGWLHTGDLGTLLPNGDIQYINRKDWMVKINGQRVEPGETEVAMKKIEGIEDAIVKGFDNGRGSNYLVGFYTGPRELDTEFLRTQLALSVSPYMIPLQYVHLDTMPINANGKKDRTALNAPVMMTLSRTTETKRGGNSFLPTEEKGNEIQEQLRAVFAQALGLEWVGLDDDFIDLGGDSIQMMRLQQLLPGMNLSSETVLKERTVRKIAGKLVGSLSTKENAVEKNNDESYLMHTAFPLTQAQLGIYAECVRREGEPMYNVTNIFRMSSRLDSERLAQAVTDAILAHPAFLAQIQEDEDGNPCMTYRPLEDGETLCPVLRIEQDELDSHIAQLRKPFRLDADRLIRCLVVDTPENQYLCMATHHIIFDGLSRQAFYQDLDTAYREGHVEIEPVTGFDVAAREVVLRSQTDELVAAREWYMQTFGDTEGIAVPAPDITTDSPLAFGEHRRYLSLSTQAFTALCKELHTSPSSVMYAAFGRLLSVYTGRRDVTFASIWYGRHDSDIQHTMMMMVRTIPVRCSYDKDTKLADYAQGLKEQVMEARSKDVYSYADLSAETGLTSDVLFAYHGAIRGLPAIADSQMELLAIGENETGEPLALSVMMEDDRLSLLTEYQSNKYSESFVERFTDAFDVVLMHMAATPDAPVSTISLIGSNQRALLDTFHSSATMELPVCTFHQGIERWAERTPDAVAVVATDKTMTYRQFDQAANQLAHALLDRGVQHGDRVVLLLPRTSRFLVAAYAVMKCGAAYIPMDPAYPTDRIAYILNDSGGRFVLTIPSLVGDYAERGIDIEELMEQSARCSGVRPDILVDPHDLAYLIYTSGSTGKPKGVMLEHLGVANFFTPNPVNQLVRICTDYATVTLCQTTLSFDLSIYEYGTPLFNGCTVVLANEEECMDPIAQSALCKRAGVECVSGTPSRIAMNMELPAYNQMMGTQIKAVMTGGEKLPWSLVERMRERHVIHINGYGPTETTMGSSAGVMSAAGIVQVKESSYVHVGRPCANYTYRILDQDRNEVPVGVVGELAIGGLSLARGYNNLPAKTDAVFIQWHGERIYMTGDYARWDEEGNVIILGRTDHQVKLNGLRIELGEIETVLSRQSGIRQCVVVIKKLGGQERLIAYYTIHPGQSPMVDELKEGMASQLTPYMVPSIFVQLDEMPVTPAGKTDIGHLPDPEVKTAEMLAPENEQEQMLYDLCCEVLGTKNFGVTTSMMSVGLSSLLSIRLSILIKKRMNQLIKVSDIMETPTVRGILARLSAVDPSTSSVQAFQEPSTLNPQPLMARPRPRTPYPLTFAQQGVYLDCMKNPDATRYNMPILLHFPATVEAEQVKVAILRVLPLHPSLFCRIVDLAGEPMMLYPDKMEVDVTVEQMSVADLISYKQTAVQPFRLSQGPMFRARVLSTEDGTYLFLDTHHLVADGSSMALIYQQLCDVLNGKDVEDESYTFFDYADRQHAWAESSDFLDNMEYFDETMSDFEASTEIPADFKTDEVGEQKEVWQSIADCMGDIEMFCRNEGITPAQFWYAVICYVLGRYGCTDDVYLCGISGGRQNLDIADTVGMFVNTLAMHTHIGEGSVRDFVATAAGDFSRAMMHEVFPFSMIADKYGFRPKFNYVYQMGLMSDFQVGGQSIQMEGLETKVPKFPVSVSIEYVQGEPCVLLQYDNALYAESTMGRLAECLVSVAKHILQAPESDVRHLSLISDAQERVLSTFHQVATMDISVKLFHQGIERWALQIPDTKAVVACDRTYTYQEYNQAANRMARAMRSHGVIQGDTVVLLLPRTSHFLVALLAVMKCGAAYIPMDPAYPADRIAYILKNSEGRFVLTTSEHTNDYANRAIDIEKLAEESLAYDSTNLDLPISPEDLAYIIYTSGSTGRPKGVMIRHLGISNCLTDHPSTIAVHTIVSKCQVMMSQTTVSFDASLHEYGIALFNGKTLVFADEKACIDPEAQLELCRRTGVQALIGTPSRIAVNLESAAYEQMFRQQIKAVVCGGEKFPVTLVEKLRDMNIAILNGYGPTETTICSSSSLLNDVQTIHVGKPGLNYTYRVLDRDRNELPVGVVGELAIGGMGLARGYVKLPERTAHSFIQWQGERLYMSGDYARWDEDGNIIILGRTDHQVKLNGLRIELGEIESVMAQQPDVKNCVVLIRRVNGQDKLVAYYTSVTGSEPDETAIRAAMAEHLTHYMVPGIFIRMEEMPLTPAGKIDTKALPEPQAEKHEAESCRNQTEQLFCDIFARILSMENVGPTDNFFEIGGTSLVAVRVVIEAMNAGYKIDYKTVFENPTPRRLALIVAPDTPSVSATETAVVSTDSGQGAVSDPPFDMAQDKLETLLSENTLQAFRQGERQPIGGAIVTGATGYLGLHIVKELLDRPGDNPVYCLVRSNRVQTALSRMRALLFYYFDDSYDELIGKRLFIIEGDVTKPESFDQLPISAQGVTHLFNCAANVKHFSAGTDIEDINLGGALNCINFCLKAGVLMVQTSTHSIAGTTVSDQPVSGRDIHENELYWGQTLDNQYIRAKFEAEKAVLQAVQERGLNAKVMRLGNLSARSTDGEFQINFSTNSFMGRLRAYQAVGSIPYEAMSATIEFSPINEVAKAIVLLSETPRQNYVFHPVNANTQHLAGVINCLCQLGIPIQLVEQEQFQEQLIAAAADETKTSILQSMLAYDTVAEGKYVVFNGVDNFFTTQVLMRLGFQWSFTTWDYIQKFITAIKGLGFFDEEYSRE